MCKAVRSVRQKGIGITEEVLASMSREESDFWVRFLREAQQLIAVTEEENQSKPFAPTESLCGQYQIAINEYDGAKYCQMQHLQEIFAFNHACPKH